MEGPFTGWITIAADSDDLTHIVPMQDTEQHYRVDCPCKPKELIDDYGDAVYVHNAFDGRDEVRH